VEELLTAQFTKKYHSNELTLRTNFRYTTVLCMAHDLSF